MYKHCLFWLMTISSAVRGGAIVVLLILGMTQLPVSILVLSSLVALLGLGLTAHKFVTKGIRLYQLFIYHTLEIWLVVFNMIRILHFPLPITAWEAVIVGTLVTIVLSGTLMILAIKQKNKYLTRKNLAKIKQTQQ